MCKRRVRAPLRGKAATRGCRGAGTHSNERKGAARGDFDVSGAVELCLGADVVVLEASNAATSEGGGRPGGDVDTADAVVSKVLRCIGREHTLSEEHAGGAVCGGKHQTLKGGGVSLCGACVHKALVRPAAGEGRDARGAQGGRHAQ